MKQGTYQRRSNQQTITTKTSAATNLTASLHHHQQFSWTKQQMKLLQGTMFIIMMLFSTITDTITKWTYSNTESLLQSKQLEINISAASI
jgi:hypothetical protein